MAPTSIFEGNPVKSVLLVGQSNMAGRGYLDDVPTICNENAFMLRNGRWQLMTEPIHFDRSIAGVGPAGSFAALWCQDHPGEQIGLIPCAEGGSSIDEWTPEGTLFRHAVSEARFALESSELIGILWHQGENDARGGGYRTYRERLAGVVRALRSELGAEGLPFVMGELADFLGKSGFGLSASEHERINGELRRFVEEEPGCYLVSAEGLTSNPDGIHIDAASQRRFGVRYYQAFAERRNVASALPDEDELLDACINQHIFTRTERLHLDMTAFAKGRMPFEDLAARLKPSA